MVITIIAILFARVKGVTMDDARLKELGGGRYRYELLNRIKDIRSSGKVVHRQVLDLYATSAGYDPSAGDPVKEFGMKK